MANLEDFMKGLAGTNGIGKDNTPLFTGQSAPITHQAFDIVVPFFKTAADGAASTNTADTIIWTNPFDFSLVVVAGRLVGQGAGVTADNTNFATIAIKTDNAAGGATATALSTATTVTDLGTLVSNVSKSFTIWTGANSVLLPGANLFINITKSGSGVVVPISAYQIRLQKGQF